MDNRLFQIYKSVLSAHIGSKTVYPLFHQKSEWWYELLFEVVHTIAEKNQDLEIDNPVDEDTIAQEVYDLIEEAKDIINDMIDEKNSPWKDNLLRSLSDKLEFACWDARAFIDTDND